MKQIYRIELFPGCNTLATELAVLAARSNGGQYLTLTEIATWAKADLMKYPETQKRTTISIIDNILLMDLGTELQIRLEEVAILELKNKEELSNDEAKGILNENLHENLN